MDDFSKTALLRFLDTAMVKGDLNGNTGGGLKSASTKLLEQLSDADDVRGVDIPALVRQYNNRHPGELSFDSLRVYESRIKRALEAFERAVAEPTKNPWGSKPSNASTSKKTESKKKVPANSSPKQNHSDAHQTSHSIGQVKTATPQGTPITNSLTIPYPLRTDFVAQVVIPIGMTSTEAKNLSKFILALAPDSSEH